MKSLIKFLFGISKIQRVQIQDGDYLIFKVEEWASCEDIENCRNHLKAEFPEHKILVLWGVDFVGALGK